MPAEDHWMMGAVAMYVPQMEASAVGAGLAWVLQSGFRSGIEIAVMPYSK